jgi:hypothetical protein
MVRGADFACRGEGLEVRGKQVSIAIESDLNR